MPDDNERQVPDGAGVLPLIPGELQVHPLLLAVLHATVFLSASDDQIVDEDAADEAFDYMAGYLRRLDGSDLARVREDLEQNAGRPVTRGALYRTIDRLTEKGFLAWELEPSEVPDRGGHPMRRLIVTAEGRVAARQARDVLFTFLDGLDPVLDA